MYGTILITSLVLSTTAFADSPRVVGVVAVPTVDVWRFDVTVSHTDAGWDHYADAWEVAASDGQTLGTRELFHPHETEQPFTRSLTGVAIPDGITRVRVRAHDSVHGWGEGVEYVLPR